MTITVLDIAVSDDPATAIFNVWFEHAGLKVSRDDARIIFDAGLNVGKSANFIPRLPRPEMLTVA